MKLLVIGPEELYQWTESVLRGAAALGIQVRDERDTTYQTTRWRLGLSRFGFPKTLVRAAGRLESQHRVLRHRSIVSTAARYKPDVTLVLKGETIAEETLAALREHTGRLVSWWVDDPELFPEAHQRLKYFHAVFAYDRYTVRRLKEDGLSSVHYLPCACDPILFYPENPDSIRKRLDCRVGMVASWYPEREELVRRMADHGLGLWGPGWERSQVLKSLPPGTLRGRTLSPLDCRALYGRAQVSPNIHHSQSREGGLNTRTFEVLAAGGFELVDHLKGLEDLLEVGREVIAYKSPEEFSELLSYYLDHPKERTAVSARGRERILKDHTYENRVRKILVTLDLTP